VFKENRGIIMNNSKKELMMVFSQHCTFFDTEDKAKIKADRKIVCPHCGSALGKMDVESWKEMIQNQVSNVPGYEEFMLWAQGKCFVNEQKAIEVYNRHAKGK
jgi:hypothetical protein